MIVQTATPADAPSLVELINRAFAVEKCFVDHERTTRCRGIDIRVVNLREELPPFYRPRGYVDRGEQPLDDPGLKRPAHFILMGKELSS